MSVKLMSHISKILILNYHIINTEMDINLIFDLVLGNSNSEFRHYLNLGYGHTKSR